eukprot:PITA_26394
MRNYERESSIRPPIFYATNFVYWKVRFIAYLQSLGTEVWDIIDTGYTFPSATPTDLAKKKQFETNAKAVNTLLGRLSQSEFINVMQYKTEKEIWDKIILSYEGDEQVKRAKLQTLRIQYENLRIYNDESVANYFLPIDEIVNCMKKLGEEIKEVVVVENVLRSLSSEFESKVSAIEEKENLQKITMSQLHEILTAYEMRKGGPSYRREAAFKASRKGDSYDSGHMSKEEEESNFVKNLQRGAGRFRGKLPFKCFACGRVDHYAAKCPHKGKEPVRWNKKHNAMGDNAFELRIPPFLGLHTVFNVDRLRPYFPPLLDTSDIAEQLQPTELNPDCMEQAATDRIMDTQIKNTHQQNIQLYRVIKAGQLLQQGKWFTREQV